jgi:hypothetical protein
LSLFFDGLNINIVFFKSFDEQRIKFNKHFIALNIIRYVLIVGEIVKRLKS